MKDLNYSIRRVVYQYREDSHSTFAARARTLDQIARDLDQLGFKHMKSPEQLKPKHVYALVSEWKLREMEAGTIKNRMSHLRWLADKVGRSEVVAKDNDAYGIATREYVRNIDRSVTFSDDKISRIPDPHIRASAVLQREFGLRREEAMKFIPAVADKGDRIELRGSWTKGGKPRTVPVRTESQREALAVARKVAGTGSLIPASRKYVEQMRLFEKNMYRVGLGRTHGARHLYAQTRYRELTGREPPVQGGLSRAHMTKEQRADDDVARLQISREMGHERIQIVSVYIGS